VSDTILFIARGKWNALSVEFKAEVGKQSDAQILWQSNVEVQAYRYEVVRSLEEFKDLINEYLEL
jgi:hypothetical protein